MNKAIVLSRVSSSGQDLTQQTDEVLREVYKDGYKDKNIIIIEDKESAIKLSEEERHGLNKMKDHINKDKSIRCVYLYKLSLIRKWLSLANIAAITGTSISTVAKLRKLVKEGGELAKQPLQRISPWRCRRVAFGCKKEL